MVYFIHVVTGDIYARPEGVDLEGENIVKIPEDYVKVKQKRLFAGSIIIPFSALTKRGVRFWKGCRRDRNRRRKGRL